MADRPHAPAPRISRPRSKSVQQTKTKEPPKKNPPKQNPTKATPPLEPKVVVVYPVDQPEEQVPLHPPNQPDQLPDIPPNQLDQVPNNAPSQPNPQANPPNQQPDPPAGQPNQPADPPANPPDLPSNPPPNQPPNPPVNPPDPMANPPPQAPQLNWSYFQPEFSGKPEEDAVAHLLRTNDWMETHDFPDNAMVRRFCLTLKHETRLWYESLRPIEIDWEALQEHFRQQYSKFSSTREQYFYLRRSFHYGESTDTTDSCVSRIKQVAALLNYGEPQILELFKNTLPSRLYYILYPIDELKAAVETAKRVLTKVKIDK